jgi:predicted PurR-regulated permease PerM
MGISFSVVSFCFRKKLSRVFVVSCLFLCFVGFVVRVSKMGSRIGESLGLFLKNIRHTRHTPNTKRPKGELNESINQSIKILFTQTHHLFFVQLYSKTLLHICEVPHTLTNYTNQLHNVHRLLSRKKT